MLAPADFKKELDKRIENKFLNFVYDLRKMSSPRELVELNKVPMEVLKATWVTGAQVAIKTWSDLVKEGL